MCPCAPPLPPPPVAGEKPAEAEENPAKADDLVGVRCGSNGSGSALAPAPMIVRNLRFLCQKSAKWDG